MKKIITSAIIAIALCSAAFSASVTANYSLSNEVATGIEYTRGLDLSADGGEDWSDKMWPAFSGWTNTTKAFVDLKYVEAYLEIQEQISRWATHLDSYVDPVSGTVVTQPDGLIGLNFSNVVWNLALKPCDWYNLYINKSFAIPGGAFPISNQTVQISNAAVNGITNVIRPFNNLTFAVNLPFTQDVINYLQYENIYEPGVYDGVAEYGERLNINIGGYYNIVDLVNLGVTIKRIGYETPHDVLGLGLFVSVTPSDSTCFSVGYGLNDIEATEGVFGKHTVSATASFGFPLKVAIEPEEDEAEEMEETEVVEDPYAEYAEAESEEYDEEEEIEYRTLGNFVIDIEAKAGLTDGSYESIDTTAVTKASGDNIITFEKALYGAANVGYFWDNYEADLGYAIHSTFANFAGATHEIMGRFYFSPKAGHKFGCGVNVVFENGYKTLEIPVTWKFTWAD